MTLEGRTAILCVDDEQTILESLRQQLRRNLDRKELLIEVASSGDEALEILEELETVEKHRSEEGSFQLY